MDNFDPNSREKYFTDYDYEQKPRTQEPQPEKEVRSLEDYEQSPRAEEPGPISALPSSGDYGQGTGDTGPAPTEDYGQSSTVETGPLDGGQPFNDYGYGHSSVETGPLDGEQSFDDYSYGQSSVETGPLDGGRPFNDYGQSSRIEEPGYARDTRPSGDSTYGQRSRTEEPDFTREPRSSGNWRIPEAPVEATKKSSGGFRTALLGAVVGGVITAIIMTLLLSFSGFLRSGSSYDENGGATVSFEGGEVASEVEAVAQVVPESVVGITVKGTMMTDSIFGQTPQGYTSFGSGFFVTQDGYIVTNQHVVSSDPESIVVSTADGSEYEGKVIWSDSSLDMAIVKVDVSGVQALSLGDSDNLKVGQTVIAIGNPMGLQYSRTVTSGIISAIDRTIVANNTVVVEGLIQTDAAINSGNSGGPLVNTQGEVIGINTYKQSQGEGIGFAIPINVFKPIIKSVIDTGDFNPVTIGITGYDPEQAQFISGSDVPHFNQGIYVVEVNANSPAQRAGLQAGDIIKSLDGKEINTMIQLRTILYNHKSGDTVKLTYQRDGTDHTVDVTL